MGRDHTVECEHCGTFYGGLTGVDVCPCRVREGLGAEERWTILSRRDWPRGTDSLVKPGAPLPDPDDDLRVIEVVPASSLADLQAERDRWIRLFNRLEGAVSRHMKAKGVSLVTGGFCDDADDALHAAHGRVLKAAGAGE